jgi:hypothetical protein
MTSNGRRKPDATRSGNARRSESRKKPRYAGAFTEVLGKKRPMKMICTRLRACLDTITV